MSKKRAFLLIRILTHFHISHQLETAIRRTVNGSVYSRREIERRKKSDPIYIPGYPYIGAVYTGASWKLKIYSNSWDSPPFL